VESENKVRLDSLLTYLDKRTHMGKDVYVKREGSIAAAELQW